MLGAMNHPTAFPAAPGRPHRSCRRRGFTIAEVALAAAIMAMGISTSITVMQRCFLMIDSARHLTTAGQIMLNQMEQVRMLDWATVSAYSADATTVAIDSAFTANPAVADRFSLTRTVTTTATANILQITYNVSWRGMDGRSTSRTMTAHYARYGIHDFIYNGS